jgi:hypothetical protein
VVMGDGSSRGGLIMMEKMPAKVGLNSWQGGGEYCTLKVKGSMPSDFGLPRLRDKHYNKASNLVQVNT